MGKTCSDAKLNNIELVTTRMDDRYVLGFAPTPRFLRIQILWILQNRFGWKSKQFRRSVKHADSSHTYFKDCVAHVRFRGII